MSPVGHPPFAYLSAVMPFLGLRSALPLGRGDRAPPRKPPSAPSPGFPHKAILPWIVPLEGRAPHAPENGLSPTETCPPQATGSSCTSGRSYHTSGLSPSLPRGRTECVPPRKPPSAPSPGFPHKAILPWIVPLEGRAPHARKGGIAFTDTCPLGAEGLSPALSGFGSFPEDLVKLSVCAP